MIVRPPRPGFGLWLAAIVALGVAIRVVQPLYWAPWTAPRSIDGDHAEATSETNAAGST